MSLVLENLPTLVQFITVNNTRIICSAIGTLLTTLLRIRKRFTNAPLRWKGKKRPEKRAKLLQKHLVDTELQDAVEDATERQEKPKKTKLRRHTRFRPNRKLRANLEDFIGGDGLTETDLMRNLKRLQLTIRTRFTLNDTASIRSILISKPTNCRPNLKLCQPSISSL